MAFSPGVCFGIGHRDHHRVPTAGAVELLVRVAGVVAETGTAEPGEHIIAAGRRSDRLANRCGRSIGHDPRAGAGFDLDLGGSFGHHEEADRLADAGSDGEQAVVGQHEQAMRSEAAASRAPTARSSDVQLLAVEHGLIAMERARFLAASRASAGPCAANGEP